MLGMGMAGKTGNYGGSKSGGNGRDPSAQYKRFKNHFSQEYKKSINRTKRKETKRKNKYHKQLLQEKLLQLLLVLYQEFLF